MADLDELSDDDEQEEEEEAAAQDDDDEQVRCIALNLPRIMHANVLFPSPCAAQMPCRWTTLRL